MGFSEYKAAPNSYDPHSANDREYNLRNDIRAKPPAGPAFTPYPPIRFQRFHLRDQTHSLSLIKVRVVSSLATEISSIAFEDSRLILRGMCGQTVRSLMAKSSAWTIPV